jgi:hypothetical protein
MTYLIGQIKLAGRGSKPSLTVNVGTAGGLRDGHGGLHIVSEA